MCMSAWCWRSSSVSSLSCFNLFPYFVHFSPTASGRILPKTWESVRAFHF
jgi:hypothetical protein